MSASGDGSTEAKDASEGAAALRIARLSALSRTLRRELLGLRDEAAIYQRACLAAVSTGAFRYAWIGQPDAARGIVRPAAEGGEGGGYAEAITIALDGQAEAYGPTATALREQRPVVCADIASDPFMTPWREPALSRGFRSSGAFPFARGGRTAGSLNVYATEPGFANPLEQYLLEGIAEDIGVALDALDLERARADAEARLIESERRHRVIFERARDGIFVADPAHRYIDVNPAGCEMLGYTRDELLALRIEDIIAPEDLASRPVFLGPVPLGGSYTSERRLRRKDGTLADVEIHGVKLSDGTLQSVVRDVSERKRSLAERVTTERMASLGRLAQGVGHEINNPLSYLMLSLELVQELLRSTPAEVRALLEGPLSHALDGAARIADIVKSLAAFGRGDAETLAAVSLERSVTAAIALTANRLRHIAKVEAAVSGAPPVLANEFQLTQVFVNLLLNAADAMEDVARDQHAVRIVARADDQGRVVVEVSDTGTGIPAEDRDRVFDPFFTTKAIGRGTGIGLSISRGIVTKFGGTLEAAAAEGGALFRLTLRVAEPAGEVALASPVAPATRLRVLVIDDEPLIGRNLARVLKGHEVVVLDAIAPAIERCRREDFDRIFCDLMFPGGSAEPLYDALLEHKPALAGRLVFMTGGAFTKASQAFLERTGRPCLSKPFSSAELLAALADPPGPGSDRA